jgi:hypothetical protein
MKSVCLLVFLCLALAGEAAAGKVAKVDLTAYLDGDPVVGDFRVYDRSDGQTLESEITDVTELKNSTRYMFQSTEAGVVQNGISEVVHGKEFRIGSEFLSSDLAFVIGKPKKIESFFFVPGVPQKAKIGFTAFFQGRRAGKVTLSVATTFVGFESAVPDAVVPAGTAQPQIVHLHRDETRTIRSGGNVFQTISTSETWIDPQLGTLRFDYSSQSFENGSPSSTFGPFTYTFSHGQHNGVPYP